MPVDALGGDPVPESDGAPTPPPSLVTVADGVVSVVADVVGDDDCAGVGEADGDGDGAEEGAGDRDSADPVL